MGSNYTDIHTHLYTHSSKKTAIAGFEIFYCASLILTLLPNPDLPYQEIHKIEIHKIVESQTWRSYNKSGRPGINKLFKL